MTVMHRKAHLATSHVYTTSNGPGAEPLPSANEPVASAPAGTLLAPQVYGTVSWKYNLNGLWSNAAYWTGGAVPGAGNNVVLNTASSHTVTFASGVGTIQALTAVTDQLAVTGGSLSVLGTATLGAGLSIGNAQNNDTAAGLQLLGPTASVVGAFSAFAGGTVSLAGTTTLSLTGAVNLSGYYYGASAPELDGGALLTTNVTTISNNYNGGYPGAVFGGGIIWSNSGTVNLYSSIYAGDATGAVASFFNTSGAIFDFTSDSGIYDNSFTAPNGGTNYGTYTFSNAGTLEKTAGSNTSSITSLFTNTGLIDAVTGTIEFDGGGSFGGTLAGPGQIAFASGTSTISATSANLTVANLAIDGGTVIMAAQLNDGNDIFLSSGSLVLDGTQDRVVNFSQYANGGTLYLNGGTLSVASGYFGAGYLEGPGTLSVSGTTTLAGYNGYQSYSLGSNVSIVNSGTVDQNSYIYDDTNSGAGFNITNQSAGTYVVTGSYDLSNPTQYTATFQNAGLFSNNGGTNTTNVYADFTNTGTISVLTGTLEFDGGGTFGGTLSGAGQLAFGYSSADTLSAGAGLTVANLLVDGGDVTVTKQLAYGGNLTLTSGALTLDGTKDSVANFSQYASGTLYLNGSTLSVANGYFGSGDLEGPGTLSVSGTTTLAGYNGYQSYSLGSNVSIVNSGTVDQNSYIYDDTNSGAGFNITNQLAGTYVVTGSYELDNTTQYASTFQNAGLFSNNGGTNTTYVYADFTNTGTISVLTGALEFDGGGTFGGTISGSGQIAFGDGGTTDTISTGTNLTVSSLLVDGGNLTMAAGVAYAGNLALSNGNLALDGSSYNLASYSQSSGTLYLYGAAPIVATSQFYQGGGSIVLNGDTLAAKNATLNYYGTVTGGGTLSLSGTTTVGDGNGYQYYIDGGSTVVNIGTLNLNQYFYFNDSTYGGTLVNAAGATFNMNAWTVYGTNSGNEIFTNAGTLNVKPGAGGTAQIEATFNNTGSLSIASGTLSIYNDTQNTGTLGGTVTGSGVLNIYATATNFAGVKVASTITTDFSDSSAQLTANTTFNGAFIAGNTNYGGSAYISLGGYTLTLAAGFTAPGAGYTLVVDGPGTLSTGGTSSVVDWSSYNPMVTMGGGGTWSNTGKVLMAGLMQLGDSGGGGTLINAAGAVFDLTTSDASITQGFYYAPNGSQISSAATIVNAGTFAKTGGTVTSFVNATFISTGTVATSGGSTLSLNEGGSLAGSIADSSRVLLGGGNFTEGVLTVGGGAALINATTVTATGVLTLGDTYAHAATYTNSGTYLLSAGDNIVTTSAATDVFNNTVGALLEQTSGTGRSLLSANIANSGTILAASGTLALTGTVTATGVLDIGAGATLEIGSNVGSTQAVYFLTNGGTLLLDSPSTAKEKIANFTVGTVIDLGNTTATSATLTGGSTLTVYNGSTAVATLSLTGTHTGDTYSFGSDGHSGTLLGISSNVSTWKGVSADWNTAADWNQGVPGQQTNASASGTNAYTLSMAAADITYANTLALSDTKATYNFNGTLNLAGTLTLSAGTLNLNGSLYSGTLTNTGGTLNIETAYWQNVTYAGGLNLSSANASLEIATPLALTGSGANTLSVTGNGATLYLDGVQTPSVTTINLGNNTNFASLISNDPNSNGSLLFLTSVINQVGTYAGLGDSGGGNDGVFNEGTLTANVAAGTFSITGDQFENDGLASVGNGDYLNVQSASVVNTGTMTAGSGTLELNNLQNSGSIAVTGGILALDGVLQNTGTITTANTAVVINGTITTAQFSALQGAGDTLDIGNSGYLNNTGATLTVGTGSALGQVSLSGTIEGGTIIDLGNGLTNQGLVTGTYGNLSDVTYEGAFSLGSNTAINIFGTFTPTGANGTGPGTIAITGGSSGLVFFDTRTVDNVAIGLGNTNAVSYLSVNDDTGNGATLTLGPNVTLTQAGGLADLSYNQSNDTIVNEGSILAQNAGGTLTVGGDGGANGTFTNAGSIMVSAGETMLLNTGISITNIAGTTLTGGSFAVGAASLMELSNNATITTDNATITLTGANSVIEALNTNTNAQVTLDQKLTKIGSAGALSLLGGRNFTASGAFTDGGKLQLGGGTFTASAGLTVSAASSLSGNGKVAAAVTDSGVISATNGTLAFSAAVSGAGTLGAAASATVQLSTGGSLTEMLSGAGTLALTGSTAYTLSAGATQTIGTVALSAGSTLSGNGAFTGGFADGGLIAVTSGTLSFAGAAGGTGVLNIAAGAVLDLQGGGSFAGGIVGAGTLQLDGATPFVLASGGALSAGAVLVDSGATLDLTGGGSLAGTLSGAGTLQLDGSTAYSIASGTTLSLGALAVDAGVALAGAGSITGTVNDSGSITAAGGTLVLGGVSGAGLLSASAGAVLDLTGGGTLAQQIGGAGTLQLDGAAPYTLQNTAGFSVGTLLIDSGVTLSGTGTISSTVTDSGTLAATGGTLALTGPLTGGGALQIGAGALLHLTAGGTLAQAITGSAGTLDLGGAYSQGTAPLAIGALIIDAGGSFSATGSLAYPITDNGALIASGGTLTVSGPLSGAGTLSAVSGAVLDLTQGGALGETVLGAGTLQLDGATPYTLAAGAISVATLSVDAGVTLSGNGTVASAISDLGTIVASGGTLALTGAITGTGPLQLGAGAVLHITAGGTLNQAVSGAGTLDLGGAYSRGTGALTMSALAIDAGASFSGTGLLSAAIANAGTLTATSATLTLSGALSGAGTLSAATGAVLDLTQGGTLAEAVTGAGSLKLDGATPYTLASAGPFSVAKLLVDSGVSMTGTGAIASAITDTGKIIASGGKLVLGGAITGAGLLQAVAGATLDLTAGGTLTNVISGAGTLEIGGAYTLGTTVPSMTNLAIDAGGSVSGTGALTSIVADAGLLSAGAGKLTVTKAISGAGTVSAVSGGTLTLSGGGTFAGNLSGAGTIAITSGLVLGSGASLSAANILATTNVNLAANASVTENAGATLTFTAAAGQIFALGTSGAESFANAGTLTANGAGVINELAANFANTGVTSVSAGTLSLQGTVTNSGTLLASGGLLSVSHLLSGAGALNIGASGTASLLQGAVSGQVVDFLAGTGALDLAGPSHFAGLIDGFGANDVIDLASTAETSFTYSGGVLTVLNGSNTVASLHFGGTYTQSEFNLASDGHSGTAITFV